MAGLYIHIPFCIKKCHYCDFYSLELNNKYDINSRRSSSPAVSRLIDNLCKEIELTTTQSNFKHEIDTVFIGGGTPSLLSKEELSSVLDQLNKYYTFKDDFEFTIECNPGTTNKEKIKDFIELGVNRISFGIQSFIPGELEFLQRIHSADEAVKSIHEARDAGIENLSIDMIFAIPGQTIESLNKSIDTALSLQPDHISYYSLIYEEGTPLYKDMLNDKIAVIGEDEDAKFYEHVIDRMTEKGYKQYEVSNFAKDGKYCYHNLNYWHCGEYLAFGPSAHGFVERKRYKNFKSLKHYNESLAVNTLPIEHSEFITDENMITELIMLGLRSDGINWKALKLNFSAYKYANADKLIDEFTAQRLIMNDQDKLRLSKSGYLLCDEIIVKILNEINL